MRKALILSDNALLASPLIDHFQMARWSSDVVPVSHPMQKSSTAIDHACVVLVIDSKFPTRYGGVVPEMGQFFSNVASKVPLYMVFEGHYSPSFNSWLGNTKRLFQQIYSAPRLREVVDEIVKIETGLIDGSGYVSPMSLT